MEPVSTLVITFSAMISAIILGTYLFPILQELREIRRLLKIIIEKD